MQCRAWRSWTTASKHPEGSDRWRSLPSESRTLGARPRLGRCHCKRDPLELEVWNSWQDGDDDWETETFSENELIDILFEEDGSAETAAQNILAISLSLLLAIAAGSILWRLLLVSWALVSAAVRYSVVAVIIVVLYLVAF